MPILLRRSADGVMGMGDVKVHGVIMCSETTEDGDRLSLTVYFDHVSLTRGLGFRTSGHQRARGARG